MFSTHAMPSSSALCASMGPSMTSPMAKTLGTLVRKWSSTSMRPRRSVSMPRFSRPRFSVKGLRPVATSTTSASKVSASPPLEGSMVSVTPASVTSEEVTLVLSLNFMPCFLRMLWNFLATSLSMPGVMRSRNSTTVTSLPRRRQTLPISRPMTPAPTTTIFSGTDSSSSAPVESTIFLPALSTGTGGSGVTSEPVAIMMFFVLSVWLPPSLSATSTVVALLSEP
mmetsp:Transcript_41442/g.129795  ORF Transcript_41442/g.129795 Transcript_41442/m.129795 type:complete len:225 (-) Transcript_41442:644-1318(-)